MSSQQSKRRRICSGPPRALLTRRARLTSGFWIHPGYTLQRDTRSRLLAATWSPQHRWPKIFLHSPLTGISPATDTPQPGIRIKGQIRARLQGIHGVTRTCRALRRVHRLYYHMRKVMWHSVYRANQRIETSGPAHTCGALSLSTQDYNSIHHLGAS